MEELLKQILTRMDDMEKSMDKKFDSIETRLDGIENRLDDIEERLDTIETDLAAVKKTANITYNHVVKYEERMTQVEKVQKLFRQDALDMTEKLAK